MNFIVFFRKEFTEQVRTYRLLIAVAIFLLFGLATPLLLKFLPVILQNSNQQLAIQIPVFTSADAVKSYVNTLSQICVLVIILVAMGSIAQERERGTAAMTLCKPLGFGIFITAKLAALVLVFSIGLVLGAMGCYLYTIVLLGNLNAVSFVLTNLLIAVYFVVCLSITVMYSTFFKNQLAAGALALTTIVGLALISNIPLIAPYMPGTLMTWAQNVATGSGNTYWPSLFVSFGLVIATSIIGWQVLSRKEL